MTGTSQLDDDDLPTLVAISLLSGGLNTLPARYAKDTLAGTPRSRWLETVAGLMWKRGGHQADAMREARDAAGPALRRAAAVAAVPLSSLGSDYPVYLREIADPPVVLWVQGATEVLGRPSVAIVGSRDAMTSSLLVARQLARGLVEAGLTVVSGLAVGVDTAAHEGALEAGGTTVAVLGSGLGHIYPKANRALAGLIARTGAVVTELPPDAPPRGRHFPLRNRIISGLSRGTVVVEASDRSGSLSTARQALDQGRCVMAVPGGTLAGRHRGCHGLLKEGARLVESVDDVLDELNWPHRAAVRADDSLNYLQLSDLEANMAKGEAYSVDQLAGVTGRSVPELLTDLSLLELSGRVVRGTGGQFVRIIGPESAPGSRTFRSGTGEK
jgi:DNA processing protein